MRLDWCIGFSCWYIDTKQLLFFFRLSRKILIKSDESFTSIYLFSSKHQTRQISSLATTWLSKTTVQMNLIQNMIENIISYNVTNHHERPILLCPVIGVWNFIDHQ